MIRMNTKNVNNKPSVFKAQLILRKRLIWILGVKNMVWLLFQERDNYIFLKFLTNIKAIT